MSAGIATAGISSPRARNGAGRHIDGSAIASANRVSAIDALAEGGRRLARAGLSNRENEVVKLLEVATGSSPVNWTAELGRDAAAHFASLVTERAAGVPLAYLTGTVQFRGIDVRVDRRALIPRAKTAALADEAEALAVQQLARSGRVVLADIGTGSGAIVLSILAHQPDIHTAFGTDVSAAALELAGENARTLGLTRRVTWRHGDLLEPLAGPIDVLVGNLPYLPPTAVAPASVEIAAEPEEAVFGGGYWGTRTLKRFLAAAPSVMAPGGHCLLEAPIARLGEIVTAATERFQEVSLALDSSGVPRVLVARLADTPGEAAS
jgi:release factor glutamine methyltransferase